MPCIPYDPQTGIFVNPQNSWAMEAPSPWDYKLITPNTFQLLKNGSEVKRITIRDTATARWHFFPPNNNFLALRDVVPSGAIDDYKVWLFDLSGSSVTCKEVPGPWEVPTGKGLEIWTSPDGLAFLLYIDVTSNSTKQHKVFRSDTLDLLCEYAYIDNEPLLVLAEITSERNVQIETIDSSSYDHTRHIYKSCPIPSGQCKVMYSPPCKFEVVWNGPEDKTSSSKISIWNTGNDCLQIDSISNISPFTVENTGMIVISSDPHSNTSEVNLTFAPTGLGTYDETLPIDLKAASPNSDKGINCTGRARISRAKCSITRSSGIPEVDPNTRGDLSYIIKNSGEDLLRIESITDSAHFKVIPPGPDYTLCYNNNAAGLEVKVEFSPGSTPGLYEENMVVTCTPVGCSTTVPCKGVLRPTLGISAEQTYPPLPTPPSSFETSSFETHCFRKQRVAISLSNTGNVPLTIDVTSSYPSFRATSIGPILKNSSQTLEVFVWSGNLGNFSVPLTVVGHYHFAVTDEQGNTIVNEQLSTSCNVQINGTTIPMSPDYLEPNDDFTGAKKVDLPESIDGTPVQGSYANLTLHDCAGKDKDFFKVSFVSSLLDTLIRGHSSSRLTLGIIGQSSPSSLLISTVTEPSKQDDGRPFTRAMQIHKSDQSLFSTCDGIFYIENPDLLFADSRDFSNPTSPPQLFNNKLYAVLSNPDYASQGPIAYDISFKYTPASIILSGGELITNEIVKLKKYYEVIWRGDPPRDPAGKLVNEAAWNSGSPIMITDVKDFIKKHLSFMSQPDILKELQKSLSKSANAILAYEYLCLAQIARDSGLFDEAEGLYKQSAAKFSKIGQKEKQADALRGLARFYIENDLLTKAINVEKTLRKISQD